MSESITGQLSGPAIKRVTSDCKVRTVVLATSALAMLLGSSLCAQAAPLTERVSVRSDEGQANGLSIGSYVSATGRYILFESDATNLVAGDTNGRRDVFLRDRQLGTTTRVSTSSTGGQGNGESRARGISGDGRFVLFDSAASNMITGDTNAKTDVFVKDRQTGATSRVNLSSGEAQANNSCYGAGISADGRYVLFGGSASNLVSGDTNALGDAFLRDRQAGTTKRVSVGAAGAQANGESSAVALSSNGRYVIFYSSAANLVGADTNGVIDVFLRDLNLAKTERVSLTSTDGQVNAQAFASALSVSADGRFVSFFTEASNVVPGDGASTLDVFLRDRVNGTTQALSKLPNGSPGGASGGGTVSSNGQFYTFSSDSKLTFDDTNNIGDVFVFARVSGANTRVSESTAGVPGNAFSGSGVSGMSSDGKVVAFTSSATNLVSGDTNGRLDVFVYAPAP
jgi:hypothetical protein